MYTVNRHHTGKVFSIEHEIHGAFGLSLENRFYVEFLEWNAKQNPPLDTSDHAPELTPVVDVDAVEFTEAERKAIRVALNLKGGV